MDVSLWSVNYGVQASGTRVKKWLLEPETNQLVLAKWPKIGTGEIYAEKISSEIGHYIDIPVMRAEIGMLEGKLVALAYNFLNTGEVLLEGGDFFEEYDRETQINRLPPNYTFKRIKAILESESYSNTSKTKKPFGRDEVRANERKKRYQAMACLERFKYSSTFYCGPALV